MKNLGKLGKISSGYEVANISPFGVWVLAEGAEYFLDHKSYPWFMNASVDDVLKVESPYPGHLRWPSLDIDLHLDALKNPSKYPLVASVKPKKNKKRLSRLKTS